MRTAVCSELAAAREPATGAQRPVETALQVALRGCGWGYRGLTGWGILEGPKMASSLTPYKGDSERSHAESRFPPKGQTSNIQAPGEKQPTVAHPSTTSLISKGPQWGHAAPGRPNTSAGKTAAKDAVLGLHPTKLQSRGSTPCGGWGTVANWEGQERAAVAERQCSRSSGDLGYAVACISQNPSNSKISAFHCMGIYFQEDRENQMMLTGACEEAHVSRGLVGNASKNKKGQGGLEDRSTDARRSQHSNSSSA